MNEQKNIPPLSTLYFYMTEGCNLACQHCWLAPKFDEDGSKYPVMDVEMFRNIIQEALPLGLRQVKLTGGEPLLHPNIYEILNILEEFGLFIWMETNGLLCDEKMAKQIAATEKPFISVSIDGSTAEVHNKIRGLPDAFERSLNGIKNLIANRVNTQIIFSIMRDNIHQYKEMIGLAASLGVASIKFNIIQPTERGKHLHEHEGDVTVQEYIEIGRHIEEELADTSPVKIYYDHPIAFRSLHRIADPATSGGTCGIKGILGVLADGTYALCGIGTSVEEMNFGRAGEESLENIWKNNAVLKDIRYNIPREFEGVCQRCLMKERCLGACVAQNYYRTRNLHASFWYCEEAERIGLFPKSRLAESHKNKIKL